MFNRSLFIKIDKLNINTIHDAMIIKEYIEACICYIVNKILLNNHYNSLDVRFQYSIYKINNSFNIVEQISMPQELLNNILSLSSILQKSIEQIIDDFYMYNRLHKSVLNINCMLVNGDSLLITYEVFSE